MRLSADRPAAWSRQVSKQQDAATIERLKDRVGLDFEQFLKRHPAFEDAWPAAVEALGRHPRQSALTRLRYADG